MKERVDVDLAAIDLKLLSILEAVLIEGNLSRAGRRLGLSQSAVSQAIARLRILLADDLFERTGRGVRPTARATSIAAPLGLALATLRGALQPPAEFDSASSDRRFFIAMRADVAQALGPRLQALLPAGSGMAFYIVDRPSEGLAAELRFGTPEVAILAEPLRSIGCRCEPLLAERLVVLARRGHPEIGERLAEETYARLSHAVLSRTGPDDRSPLDAEFERRGIARRVPMALPSLEAVVALVARSDLVCTVPARLTRSLAAELGLVTHELPFPQPEFAVHLAWHGYFDNDAGHRWLREQIKTIFAAL